MQHLAQAFSTNTPLFSSHITLCLGGSANFFAILFSFGKLCVLPTKALPIYCYIRMYVGKEKGSTDRKVA